MLGVVGGDHATLPHGEGLGGVEAVTAEGRVAAQVPAIVLGAVGLGTVVNKI